MSGESDISFPRITRRFDVQHFTTGRCVSQPRDNTRLARFESGLAHVFGWAEHFDDQLGRDRGVLGFSPRHLRCNSTTNRRNLPLKLADARFMCVVVNDPAERFVLPFDLFGLKSVFLQLPSDEISFGDLEFFALGVTRQ